jgi:hypothetical protein
MVRDDMLECHRESAAKRSNTVQTVLPQRKVKEVPGELHRGFSGGHLVVNSALDRVTQWYFWLHTRNNVQRRAHYEKPAQQVETPYPEPRPDALA